VGRTRSLAASLRCIAATGCALALAAAGCGGDAGTARSVVLIVVDTLRADHLGVYGHEAATSAELDLRAPEAALFERAFAASSWTLPSFGETCARSPRSSQGRASRPRRS
jgi:glucan phosphoethanolaminetransferase (alkaline phosphatase superfamily)